MLLNGKKCIEIKPVFLALIIVIWNVVFLQNYIMSLLLVVIEVIVLFYLLFTVNFKRYYYWYLIFLGSCIEFAALVSNEEIVLYNFKSFRLMNINIALILSILPWMLILSSSLNGKPKKKLPYCNLVHINIIMRYFIFLSFLGIINGLLNILSNNNNIQNYPNLIRSYIEQIYTGIWPFIMFFIVYYIVKNYKDGYALLEEGLLTIIIANALGPLIPALFGLSGSYGRSTYMLASSANVFIPFIAILPLYPKYRVNRLKYLIYFIVGCILPMVFFNYINGKMVIFIIMIPFLYILISKLLSIKTLIRIFVTILLILIIILLVFKMNPIKKGSLVDNKIKEAKSLTYILSDNWEILLGLSVRYRVYEFINLFEEYQKDGIQIYFGKGFMGSIQDHHKKFGWKEKGSFPDAQFDNNSFFSLHEISNYLLKFGLFGIFIIIVLFRYFLKLRRNNPWIIIGFIWFFLFYSFSMTVSIIGITALALGLIPRKGNYEIFRS